jgi:hypothetical protein
MLSDSTRGMIAHSSPVGEEEEMMMVVVVGALVRVSSPSRVSNGGGRAGQRPARLRPLWSGGVGTTSWKTGMRRRGVVVGLVRLMLRNDGDRARDLGRITRRRPQSPSRAHPLRLGPVPVQHRPRPRLALLRYLPVWVHRSSSQRV